MTLTIAILGLGPVGASLGLALGTLDPSTLAAGRPLIVGWDREKSALKEARGRLAVDRAEADLETAVRGADVIIATVPFGEMRDLFAAIAPWLKHGAVVTDTTTTKAQILEWAGELLPVSVEFVGGHPLASTGGAAGPARAIFEGAIYCLVPLPRTRRTALDSVESLVTAIGAKPYYIDAVEHDSYVAAAGHLPLAVSLALMETVAQSGGWREILPIAGEGLVRMTELVAIDPNLAGDELVGNAAALDGWIDRMIESLLKLQRTVRDPTALQGLLERSQDVRANWLLAEPNVRPGERAFLGDMQEADRPTLGGLFFGRRRSGPGRDKRR
jgi:prephenate dehydrogenase